MHETKKDIINQLQQRILHLQGINPPLETTSDSVGLSTIESVFPNGVFPKGAIHEFLGFEQEHAASCSGFISGILATLMQHGGACLWISIGRTLFPPALKTFGVEPDKIIFIDLKREKDILWATEEALKCEGLAAVVTEVSELTFAQSRRLQLAVEKSKVTGFVLRNNALKLNTTACVARWQITSLPSKLQDEMPGVGFPRWQVELLRVRNGNPGKWTVEWLESRFNLIPETLMGKELHELKRKAG